MCLYKFLSLTEIDVCNIQPCVFECVPAGGEFMCGCPPGYQMIGQGSVMSNLMLFEQTFAM
jgi:hypothetical protein